jgi:sulfatase maturation enzyme AslB (radical SAM superfamily)
MLINSHEFYAFDSHFIGIIFGMNCNLRCKLCYVDFSQPNSIEEINSDQIMNFIEKYDSKVGLDGIWWCGYGEVFTDSNFIPLINRIGQRFPHIQHTIQTNGTISRGLETITCWKKISEIAVSIDGTELYHNQNRGLGMFQKTMKFLEFIAPLVPTIKIRSIVTKQNLESIPVLFRDLKAKFPNNRLKFSLIPLLTEKDMNSGPYHSNNSNSRLSEIFTAVTVKEIHQYFSSIELANVHYEIESHDCHFVSLTLLKSEIYACCETFYKIGSVKDSIEDILDNVKKAVCTRCGNCRYARFGSISTQIPSDNTQIGPFSISNQLI